MAAPAAGDGLLLDSHVDTLERVLEEAWDPVLGQGPGPKPPARLDLGRMVQGGMSGACFAAYLPQGPLEEAPRQAAWDRAVAMLDALEALERRAPERCALAHSPEAFRRLHAQGLLALVPCIENAYPIGEDLARLDPLAHRGLCYITLCHNGTNWVCGSSREAERGLTDFGRRLVTRMNALGILVDVSHASERAALEAIDTSRAPVIASHSSCHALCAHPRNLSDGAIRAIAGTGGVVQVCAYAPFLVEGTGEGGASVADFAAHLEHVIEVAGEDHVGLGTDFDGGGWLSDCRDASELPALVAELRRRGWSRDTLAKCAGGNFLRAWQGALDAADYSPR